MGRRSRRSSLWTPKTYEDLHQLKHTNLVYSGYVRVVVQSAPGVLIKYGGDFAEEVRAIQYARKTFSFPVPQILHHPSFSRGSKDPPLRPSGPRGVWYFCIEQCPGVTLDKVIDTMAADRLSYVADQLKDILREMNTLRPKTLGSVTNGPYRNGFFPTHVLPNHPFTSYTEFIDLYRYILLHFCTETYTDDLLSRLPRNAPIRFAHADLHPRNIIVDEATGTITGIIDWATAGFWPGYLEYCRMHTPRIVSPGWEKVLERIFPGKRRQVEIDAVNHLLTIVDQFFYC